MNCSEATENLRKINETDQKLRRILAFARDYQTSDFQIRTELKVQMEVFDEAVIPNEYRRAYEKWKRYEPGQEFFTLTKNSELAKLLSDNGRRNIFWRIHPKGIVFQATNNDRARFYLFEHCPENLVFDPNNWDPYAEQDGEPEFLDDKLIYEDNFPGRGQYLSFQSGPKGVMINDRFGRCLLDGKEIDDGHLGSDSKRYFGKWRPHIRGVVETCSTPDYDKILFMLNRKKMIGSADIVGYKGFDFSPAGIYMLYDNVNVGVAKRRINVYLNGKLIWRDLLQENHFWAHPDGSMALVDNRLILNNENVLYERKPGEDLYASDIMPYPGGVVIGHRGRDGSVRWVFHDGSQTTTDYE